MCNGTSSLRQRVLSEGDCAWYGQQVAANDTRFVVKRTFLELSAEGAPKSETRLDCHSDTRAERWADDDSTCEVNESSSEFDSSDDDSTSTYTCDVSCGTPSVTCQGMPCAVPVYFMSYPLDASSGSPGYSPGALHCRTVKPKKSRAKVAPVEPVQQVQELPNELRTTLVIRNLPSACTSEQLSTHLNDEGFRGKYDFVYVPLDLKKRKAFGFAFVNMLSNELAQGAIDWLDGCSDWSEGGDPLELQWTKSHQGLEAQVSKYRDSPIMHTAVPAEFQPMLFRDGALQPFPSSTQRVAAPKLGKAA